VEVYSSDFRLRERAAWALGQEREVKDRSDKRHTHRQYFPVNGKDYDPRKNVDLLCRRYGLENGGFPEIGEGHSSIWEGRRGWCDGKQERFRTDPVKKRKAET